MSSDFPEKTEEYLRILGYELTTEGLYYTLMSESSSYSAAEAASSIALITMCKSIKKENSYLSLMMYFQHMHSILEVLKNWKDNGLIHPTEWQNLANAFFNIGSMGKNQMNMIDQILKDPMTNPELAICKVDYELLSRNNEGV